MIKDNKIFIDKMNEVYGLVQTKCSKCNVDYVPGNMFFIPNGMRICVGSNILAENVKCMKCPKCGESRIMTSEEENNYKAWYRKIEL